ncbi:related to Enolase-phosphatase E1 [Rhynchosporium secalis]|uniref:Enolase-phosphatase E1 n=1 Tax=Rhynchosporium secalis TaxID=38038 RepID=A0A1E1MMA6_RHYSE|nr:related to Enolase-phosphatase E1 [Rhynchosporium secalis]
MADKLEFEGVVLDIEGTVCPISFVKDVLFPYALTHLDTILSTSWSSPSFTPYRDAFPSSHRHTPDAFRSHIHSLVAADVKSSPLKNLQGYLWLSGYENGSLSCPLFKDVPPAFKRWTEKGIPIVIYSSGSVAAQKLLFKYTDGEDEKNLTRYIKGYFDTVNAGMKGEKSSYVKIVEGIKQDGNVDVQIGKWLFCSDRVVEVDAAKEAGMQAVVVVREGNAKLSESEKERNILIESFDQIA